LKEFEADLQDAELVRARDEARCEAAVQTVVDVLMRLDDLGEGTYSAYDVLGFVMEDLMREGFCPACISDSLQQACQQVGLDRETHQGGDTLH